MIEIYYLFCISLIGKATSRMEFESLPSFPEHPQFPWAMSSFGGNLSSVRRVREYFRHGLVDPVDLIRGRRKEMSVKVHGHLKGSVTKEFLESLRRCPCVDHDRNVEVPKTVHVVFRLPVRPHHPDPSLNRVDRRPDLVVGHHISVFIGEHKLEITGRTDLLPTAQIRHKVVANLDCPIARLGLDGADLSLPVCPVTHRNLTVADFEIDVRPCERAQLGSSHSGRGTGLE